MNTRRRRPLSLDHLRSFAAVARRLNFSQAAEDLHFTQPAISRQIKTLEDELGASLFHRGTRKVELSAEGKTLLQAVVPWLDRLDATVHQIRESRGRRVVNLTTFPSFASLWLLPRLEAFQRDNPDIDIRISAVDHLVELDDSEFDLALRYCHPDVAPKGSLRMFGEVLTPVVGTALRQAAGSGRAHRLEAVADLAHHTLLEEDDARPSGQFLSWRRWLMLQGHPNLEPRRWLYLNFTYQQVQAALTGQGVALARLGLIWDALQRGELVEPFGPDARTTSPYAYFLVTPAASPRPELQAIIEWISEQAADTRKAVGDPGA